MSHAVVPATTPSPTTAAIQTRLSGRWLWLARVVWLSAATLLIASFLLTLPLTYAQVQQVCTGAACEGSLRPEDLPVLAAWGLSPAFIAIYGTVLVGLVDLVWIVMGLLLFVRRSAEPHILFFSLCLLLFGGGPKLTPAQVQPSWWLPVAAYMFLTFSCLFVFVYVFPTGQFVPRWTRWAALVLILGNVPTYFFPDSHLNPSSTPAAVLTLFLLGWLGSVIMAQVYR